MSWTAYRDIKVERNSDGEFDLEPVGFCPNTTNSTAAMDAAQLQAIIAGAVNQALTEQENRLKRDFQAQLDEVKQQMQHLRVEAPQVETYQKITAGPEVRCDIKLDIVKTMPDFSGEQDDYVSWRQSAVDAYEIFKRYNGSEAHYQAVSIIRNKIRGPARGLLVAHNTVLNFDAIIARLDCTYADKTSLRVLRQGLDTVRQGELSLMQYYDDVEKRLTLITNKIVMTHEPDSAILFNNEVREDALHAFIAGLRKPLRAIVLPAQPKDLPSALALARESEATIERTNFAATYAKALEDKAITYEHRKDRNHSREPHGRYSRAEDSQGKNPHFYKKQGGQNNSAQNNNSYRNQSPEPMELGSTVTQRRQPTSFGSGQPASVKAEGARGQKRFGSARMTGQRRQRVQNTIQQADDKNDSEYDGAAAAAVTEIDDESDENDQINFLGSAPDCRSLNASSMGGN
uniref:Gag protein n=1 Tax=Drosophila melanogaster TaxID=7227 RepID=D7QZ79_DROME|nr:gag protein [Drosophila melanogaster]